MNCEFYVQKEIYSNKVLHFMIKIYKNPNNLYVKSCILYLYLSSIRRY